MDSQIIIQYLIVLLSLIVLEGLLSADNAIVLAVMVRHLPKACFIIWTSRSIDL